MMNAGLGMPNITSTTLRSDAGQPAGGPIGETVQSVDAISASGVGKVPLKQSLWRAEGERQHSTGPIA